MTSQQIIRWLWVPALSLILSGCYTVLRHEQEVVEEPGEEEAETVAADHGSACASCHDSETDSYYHAAYSQPVLVGGYARWSEYFDGAAPWWQAAPAEGDDASGSDGSQRTYGRRRPALNNKEGSSLNTANASAASGGGSVITTGNAATSVSSGMAGGAAVQGSGDTTNSGAKQSPPKDDKQRDYSGRKTKKK